MEYQLTCILHGPKAAAVGRTLPRLTLVLLRFIRKVPQSESKFTLCVLSHTDRERSPCPPPAHVCKHRQPVSAGLLLTLSADENSI